MRVGDVVRVPLGNRDVVAFVVVHESVDESPVVIEVGDADNVQVGTGGGGGGITVTIAVHVTVPPEPVAVPVYVTVVSGETDNEPPETVTIEPILLTENDVAFVVVHESVDESPVVIEVGDADRVQVGAGGGGATVTGV